MTIGERIKAAREARGATQGELAKAAHTTKQTIYKYENGIVSNIPSDKIEAMAAFLSVSESYLMGWEITMPNCETELIECYRNLDADRANRLFQYAKALLETQRAETEMSGRNGGSDEESN